MIVGGYELHLYCEGRTCAELAPLGLGRKRHPGQFGGRNERAARKEARAAGWRFKGGECYCKECACKDGISGVIACQLK